MTHRRFSSPYVSRLSLKATFVMTLVAGSLHSDIVGLAPPPPPPPNSDTLTVNFGGRTGSLNAPEIDETSADDILSFSFLNNARLPRYGYVLICEPGIANCGPQATMPFNGVSDIAVSGILTAERSSAIFLYSRPFTPDSVRTLVGSATFLGQDTETGLARDISSLFGAAAGSVVVTSDVDPPSNSPEPSTPIILLGAGLLLLWWRLPKRGIPERPASRPMNGLVDAP